MTIITLKLKELTYSNDAPDKNVVQTMFLVRIHVLQWATLGRKPSFGRYATSFVKSSVHFQTGSIICPGKKCITFERLQMVQTVFEAFGLVLKFSVIILVNFEANSQAPNFGF